MHFDRISMTSPILYFKGTQIVMSKIGCIPFREDYFYL